MVQLSQSEPGARHMVIVGCDELAVNVASMLSEQGHSLHVLDLTEDALERLPAGMIEDGHITPLVGDGTREDDLIRASIQDAAVFMALSGGDTRNALAAQIAKQVFQVPTVICRIDDPSKQALYNDLGIVAISAISLVTGMVVEAATL